MNIVTRPYSHEAIPFVKCHILSLYGTIIKGDSIVVPVLQTPLFAQAGFVAAKYTYGVIPPFGIQDRAGAVACPYILFASGHMTGGLRDYPNAIALTEIYCRLVQTVSFC